jgi:hypothetical protein
MAVSKIPEHEMTTRLFAFGCSMTSYAWPTWADFIAVHNDYDQYYNFAQPGIGNKAIEHLVYEADMLCDFGPSDTILVMMTSPWRNDVFINGQWQSRGSVYNDNNRNLYTPDWQSKFWSPEMGMMYTWSATRAIVALMHSKNISNYYILAALPYSAIHTEFFDNEFDYDVELFRSRFISLLHVKQTLHEHMLESFDVNDRYWFDDMNCFDVHPTALAHALFVQHHLPEFYNNEITQAAKQIHANIDHRGHLFNFNNPDWQKYHGFKMGSLTYTQPTGPIFRR